MLSRYRRRAGLYEIMLLRVVMRYGIASHFHRVIMSLCGLWAAYTCLVGTGSLSEVVR